MSETLPLDGNLKSPSTHQVDQDGPLVTGQPVQRRPEVPAGEAPGGYHTDQGGPGGGRPLSQEDDRA